MRRIVSILLSFILFFALAGCKAEEEEPQVYRTDTMIGNQSLSILFDDAQKMSGVVQAQNGDYRFELGMDSIKITYPDGYEYSQTTRGVGNTISIATSADYDGEERAAKGYVDGMELADVIMAARQAFSKNPKGAEAGDGKIFLGPVLILAGVVMILCREKLWWLKHGWQYKNAQPSDMALGTYVLGGTVLIIWGLIWILVGIMSFF